MEDGVYFGLDESVYHAEPRLSASGIKNLLISPMEFWANSWMNSFREEENESAAMFVGKAYHKRILEGKQAFDSAYTLKFDAPAGALKTIDDLKSVLREHDLPLGGKKEDLIDRVLENFPSMVIEDVLKHDYDTRHHGKQFLSERLMHSIEISAAMIERSEQTAKFFRGGVPEVTVFWTENDIKMKARFDYLKPKAIVDLKSFSGNGMDIERAIYNNMARYKYYVQACVYLKAVKAAQKLLFYGCRPDFALGDWAKEFTETKEFGFYFVFQQTGNAPLVRIRKVVEGQQYRIAMIEIETAQETYKTYLEKYGNDPWLDEAAIEELDDDRFPAWA